MRKFGWNEWMDVVLIKVIIVTSYYSYGYFLGYYLFDFLDVFVSGIS